MKLSHLSFFKMKLKHHSISLLVVSLTSLISVFVSMFVC